MLKPAVISLRRVVPANESLLWDMLYHAIYVSQGNELFPREIVQQPALRRYVESWGRPYDDGFVAVAVPTHKAVGAVWMRLLTGENKGYGYVDDAAPELSIAVLPEYRGQGVGTKLLMRLLAEATKRHRAISLSVAAVNPAVRLYQRPGFEIFAVNDHSLTMIKRI